MPVATVAMPSDVFFTMAISAGVGIDQIRAVEYANALVGRHPLLVMHAAEFERVLRKILHRLGGTAAKAARLRRDSDRPDCSVTGNWSRYFCHKAASLFHTRPSGASWA